MCVCVCVYLSICFSSVSNDMIPVISWWLEGAPPQAAGPTLRLLLFSFFLFFDLDVLAGSTVKRWADFLGGLKTPLGLKQKKGDVAYKDRRSTNSKGESKLWLSKKKSSNKQSV